MGARARTFRGSRRLGNYLYKLRTGYGYSMRRVGERARAEGGEIDNSQLSRYEKGICYPSFDKLRVLASVFNVSVQSFSDMADLEAIEPIVDASADPAELIEQGNAALKAGENGKSFACFERAQDLLLESPHTPERETALARVHISQAVSLIRLGRLALAEQELRKALRADSCLEPEERVRALLGLINVQADQGDTLLALMGARQAHDLASEAQLDRLTGMSLHTMARVLAERGEHAEAISRFRQTAEIYARCGEQYEALRVRINIGTCYVNLGKRQEGARLLRSALSKARAGWHRRLEALAWSSLGEAHFRQSDFTRAGQCFNQSNALASFNRENQPDLLFLNAFYQWKMAANSGNPSRERMAFGRLRALRSKLERTFPEVRAFDQYVEGRQIHA